MVINDGGPAYPFEGGDNNGIQPSSGMSLRDAFAIAALPAIYAESVRIMEVSGFPDENWRDGVAMDVYTIADAMIRARTQDASHEQG